MLLLNNIISGYVLIVKVTWEEPFIKISLLGRQSRCLKHQKECTVRDSAILFASSFIK